MTADPKRVGALFSAAVALGRPTDRAAYLAVPPDPTAGLP